MTKSVKILIGILAMLFVAANAYAGTPISLYQSLAGNLNYTGTGGTLRTGSNVGGACTVINTSSAILSGIPVGATVEAAYLYWAGSYSVDAGSTQNTPDYDITFNGYDLTAERTFTETFNYNGDDYDFFSGFVDVTNYVILDDNNTFSNLTVNTGDPHCSVQAVVAGWSLLVIYEEITNARLRVVNVFDGFQYHRGSAVSVTPSNFRIPSDPAQIDGKMSHISWEGDEGNSGPIGNSSPQDDFTEEILFNGNPLTDGLNPIDNQFNSTINILGTDTSYGVDFDTYDISTYLNPNDISATSTFSTGADLVLLSAEIISVTNTSVADLAITKSHTGDFTVGQDGVYTIEVTNNGPSDETDTITVTDTLPTGLSYVSSSGTGWTLVDSSEPTISWTYSGTVPVGNSLPTITLTVNPDANAIPAVTNTVTVSSPTFDNIPDNDIALNPTNVLGPDLTTSTITVYDLNGGYPEPGDVLRYTITLVESGGGAASGVSVTDNIPANITDFTVIAIPVGSTDNSLAALNGMNNTGFLDITDISVPVDGSVAIIFEVTVAADTPAGTVIENSAVIDNPLGVGGTITAPSVVVSESSAPANGNKSLYLYSSPNDLNRTPPSTLQSDVTIRGRGESDTWTMTPVCQADITIDGSSGGIPVVLWLSTSAFSGNREITVELRSDSGVIGSLSQIVPVDTIPQEFTFNVPVSGDASLNTGEAITLYIENNEPRTWRNIIISPEAGGSNSRIDLYAETVINVDSIEFYDAAYPGGGLVNLVKLGETIYVRSVISDPFGSFDISNATLDIIDSDGLPPVISDTMINVADSGAATSTWELGVIIASSDPTGIWTARVTAVEGTEGVITHTAFNTFRVITDVTSVEFTDAYGNSVNGYPMDGGTGTAYIRVVDESANANPGIIETVSVTVGDSTTGDSEQITLYETGPNTGVFENNGSSVRLALPLSTTDGLNPNNGTLYVIGGYNIDVIYNSVSDTVYIPTLAIISSFRTVIEDGQVVVEWETASEIGTVGFNLLRKDDGKFIRLNDRLLPGLLVSAQGGNYRFVDTTAVPGVAYTYKLIEKEARSRRKCVHGPYTVTAEDVVSESSYASTRQMKMFSGSNYYSNTENKKFKRESRKKTALKKLRVNARKNAKKVVRRFLFPWQRSRAKISVTDSGFYYIDRSAIEEALGISSRTAERLIRKQRLSLTTKGEPVSWKQAEDNKGIIFFGKAVDSIYTNENIYWLKTGRGFEMESTESRTAEYDSGYNIDTVTFTCNIHREENSHALPGFSENPDSDYWSWEVIVAGIDSEPFSITTEGAARVPGMASLSVNLRGGFDDPECDMDHHVEVSLNGNKVGEGSFDGTSTSTIEIFFDQLLLDADENFVEIKGLTDTGAIVSIFYVNSFDLSYQRSYFAQENMLKFTGDENETVTVTGFTNPNIALFDITDPQHPVALSGIVPEDSGGGIYSINFAPSGADTPYVAVASGGFEKAVSVNGCSQSWLKKRWNGADYIVIAPAELSDAADVLCEYRKQQGLETMVVELSDIMDEFNYGIYSPEAIKDFLAYTYYKWRKAPEYIVLAGDGSYDYKNYMENDDNLMPPLMISTPDGLFASDSRFADIEGNDGVPEMAVGRLPVLTSDEFLKYIEKVKAYESSAGLSSPGPVMMLADKQDNGGDFTADSDAIASLLPSGFYAEKIYLGALSIDDARNKIIEGFQDGPALVNYLGHGALDRYAGEGMLTSEDVAILEGSGKYPVVAAMTCVAGRFSFPGFDCLGEVLVTAEDGGAVAVWSPTGFSMNSEAKILDEEFFKILFHNKEKILGRAILKAYRKYVEKGCEGNLPAVYNLLGDPALRVR